MNILFFVILSILTLSVQVHSDDKDAASSSGHNETSHSVFLTPEEKKEAKQMAADVAAELEILVKDLPHDSFAGDPILEQIVDDGPNDLTYYKLPGAKKEDKAVFERRSKDTGKEAIVLLPGEDDFVIRKVKKMYIALKKTLIGNNYHPFLIYIRESTENDLDVTKIQLGGGKKIIEYDTWVYRPKELAGKPQTFGWNECGPSIFVPCANPDFDKEPNGTNFGGTPAEKKEKKQINSTGTFKTEKDFKIDEDIDLYTDLEEAIQEGRGLSDFLFGDKDKDDDKRKEKGKGHHKGVLRELIVKGIKAVKEVFKPKESLETALYSHQGWKTLGAGGKPGDTLKLESSDAFVGFGLCPYKSVTKADWESTSKAEEFVKLVATATRTQCGAQQTKFYDELLTGEYIKLGANKTFEIIPGHKTFNLDKMSPTDASIFTRAFEMSIFSRALQEELTAATPHVSGTDGSKVTRSVHVLAQAVLKGIDDAKTTLRHHHVKILRNLAITVKTAFMKLLQDEDLIENCAECTADKEANAADQQHLMGLMRFMIHGLSPVDRGNQTAAAGFKFFADENKDLIAEKVSIYQ